MSTKMVTEVNVCHNTWAVRRLVLARLPGLTWRRHGIGVLQAYLDEGNDRELRVHIWSEKLMVPGIRESGNAHDHRFDLVSTVLTGTLRHTEWRAKRNEHGDHALYDFVHARNHTEENRADMRMLEGRYTVIKREMTIPRGHTYKFRRGEFHSSEPVSEFVVTLVEKRNQRDVRALVIAPISVPPVPAFKYGEPERSLVEDVLEQARLALEVPDV